MNGWRLDPTDYPATRRVMGPIRERLDDQSLEAVLEEVFPDTAPEHVEDFMQSLQQFGRQAAPIAQKVAPGMAQGAAQGAALGPYGALFGALAGGASSLLQSSGPSGPGPGAAAPAVQRPAPIAAPPLAGLGSSAMPPAAARLTTTLEPAATPGQAPATVAPAGQVPTTVAPAQLLALLSQPETMQALLALVMGQYGRTSLPVGAQQVPPAAFATAISELAAEAAGLDRGTEAYWYDPHGAPRCDVSNPGARAALVMSDLAEAVAAERRFGASEPEHDSEEEEENDALEILEAILAGDESDDY